jgi:hypothetical protein
MMFPPTPVSSCGGLGMIQKPNTQIFTIYLEKVHKMNV